METILTDLTDTEVTNVDQPPMRMMVAELSAAEWASVLAESPQHSPPRRPWPRRVVTGLCAGIEWLFGVVTLLIGLGVLASLPVLQVISLGYLLEASGRVARSGRIRDGVFGVRTAAWLGGLATGTWLCFLPLRFVWQMWFAAWLIDPGSVVTAGWRIALVLVLLATMLHVVSAWYAGGRWRHFFWLLWAPFVLVYELGRTFLAFAVSVPPLHFILRDFPRLYTRLTNFSRPTRSLPPVQLWSALRQGRILRESTDAIWTLYQRLRIASYFWLGFRGFIGALIWLAVPALLLVAVTHGKASKPIAWGPAHSPPTGLNPSAPTPQRDAAIILSPAERPTPNSSPYDAASAARSSSSRLAETVEWPVSEASPHEERERERRSGLDNTLDQKPVKEATQPGSTSNDPLANLDSEKDVASSVPAPSELPGAEPSRTVGAVDEQQVQERDKREKRNQPPIGRVLAGLLGSTLMAAVLLYLPFVQAHFAAERRFRAFFEVGQVRALFRRAPLACWLALLVTLSFALPLYLLKIEFLPRELLWVPSLIFVAFGWPARLVMGWAMSRARRREQPRFFLFCWFARFAELPVIAVYVLVLYVTQYVLWNGAWSLFEQHAFLLPAPFLSL